MHAVNSGRRLYRCWVVVICKLRFTLNFMMLVSFSQAKYHGNVAHVVKFSSTDLKHKSDQKISIL